MRSCVRAQWSTQRMPSWNRQQDMCPLPRGVDRCDWCGGSREGCEIAPEQLLGAVAQD